MTNKRSDISSFENLQKEKAILRDKVLQQEQVLKVHYQNLSEKISPALKIANFITGNKLFGAKNSTEHDETKSSEGINWMSTILKVITAATAGGFILNRTKKNFGRAIFAYAIEQGLKFITEKDITEHIEKVKEWLSKKEKNREEPE